MPDQVKNGLIGVFVMVGFAILVFIILFLHPQVGMKPKRCMCASLTLIR